MDELISTLVPPNQQAAAQRLLDDPDSRNLIRQQLSQLAEDNAGLVPQTSFNWIQLDPVQALHVRCRRNGHVQNLSGFFVPTEPIGTVVPHVVRRRRAFQT